jgi:beta-mannosidase
VGWTPGQVVGGRWKTLHYFYARALYRDHFASCGADGRCFVRNDDPLRPWTGTLTTSFLHVTTGAVTVWNTSAVALPRGAAATAWSCLGSGSPFQSCQPVPAVLSAAGCAPSGADCVLLLSATNATGATVVDWWQLLTVPSNMTLDASAAVTATIAAAPAPDGTLPITVTADATAIFVTLTTLAQGRFSDNAFHVPKGASVTVSFIPFGDLDAGTLAATLRVEHFAQYQPGGVRPTVRVAAAAAEATA